ncbi:hypothetical protein [uncultured Selenomonas sp.]|uniref:O-linked N-acetylglucosamine transferase family protein n=1 Tax=uncultured Selenomonas sp. TaxID=159275 RepID=UPI0025D88DC8|nr:hypothetical protein [uncultured Selenomonas sp.]
MEEERWRTMEHEGAACRLTLDAKGCARAYYEAAASDRFLRSQREHYSSYLFALHYLTGIEPEAMAEQHRVYGKLYPQPTLPPLGEVARRGGEGNVVTRFDSLSVESRISNTATLSVSLALDSSPRGGALKVGFLAPHFCESSAARFYEALLCLPQKTFETFAYSLSEESDAFTAQVQSMVTHYSSLASENLERAEQIIAADVLDVLVDLGGHTDGGGTLMLLANHPAKRIIEAVGWFDTTGLAAVDELLTDDVMDPAGREALLSERPLRLPHAWCFTPNSAMRAARERVYGMKFRAKSSQTLASLSGGGEPRSGGGLSRLLALQRLEVAYADGVGSPLHGRSACTSYRLAGARTKSHVAHLAGFQNFLKLNDEFLRLWKNILARTPQAHLHLRDTMQSPERIAALTVRCRELGLPMERVTIEQGTNDYLDALARMDLVLDTYPYPGGAMTATALYLGVPVLTRRGDSHSRSVGASILMAAELPELIAETEEDYIEKAVELASRPEKLAALREKVWHGVPSSPLCDVTAYQTTWQRALRS